MNSVKISEVKHYEETCDIRVEGGEVVFYWDPSIPCEMAGIEGNTLLRTTRNLQEVTCQGCLAVVCK